MGTRSFRRLLGPVNWRAIGARVARRRQHIPDYNDEVISDVEVSAPESEETLLALLNLAPTDEDGSGRPLTIAAGRNALGGQAEAKDAALDMTRFGHNVRLETDGEAGPLVICDAAASWGEIVGVCRRKGYVPYVVVSVSTATAGGTVSSDSLSRFSPSVGKESRYVAGLRCAVTRRVRGVDDEHHQVITLVNPARYPQAGAMVASLSEAENADLFHSVVGGFGLIAVILEVAFEVFRVPGTEVLGDDASVPDVWVETEEFDSAGFVDSGSNALEATVSRLIGCTDKVCRVPEQHRTVYAVALPNADISAGRTVVFKSRYCTLADAATVDGKAPAKRFFAHRPTHLTRHWVERMMSWNRPTVLRAMERITWGYMRWKRRRWLDPLTDFTFFMDANRLARERFGMPLPVVQQTFVVPAGLGEPVPAASLEFICDIGTTMANQGVTISLFDMLYLPADSALLSASRGMSGIAVTLTFMSLRGPRKERVTQALIDLSARCLQAGGRVHLVKNVFASTETLAAMYGEQLDAFDAARRRYGADLSLTSVFWTDILRPALDHYRANRTAE